MPTPTEAEVLRHIAREEPLTATVRAFRGMTRERLGQLLEQAAEQLAPSASPAAPEPAERAEAPVSEESRAPMPRLRLYSDGAARGNPGPAGAGAVLIEPGGQVVARIGKFLGQQTNNYAEYMGLLIGLKHARGLGTKEIEIFADSELLIRQLGGRYQVKSPTLRPLYEEAVKLLNDFSRVKLVHVPREMNAEADEMSNRAIDERL
ncbi:ribonuclease HI family protein [Stigmatella sp. ncwal1]|uniref:Ribonuclease HI family protein n=1 Tax=Stigmatella ashevillensis TaxID=2995309 RepID=A0ABT5D7S6_9BACT|nr:ribonuclease HI family protein [Stigmatella ashevillena]MDC0709722.1 ribonuclease HI family protein [Stigmatella ashevillena]